MLRTGVIEPSTSPFSSPPVLVERDGKPPRFCVDFRALNELTEDESTTLPNISETLKDFGNAKYFTTLDLKAGYWQIPLDKDSRKYTAFSTPDGAVYHFRVLPFGLKCAPNTFQNLMAREVLPGYLHIFTKVYLDDIIVYSESLEDHERHLRMVFERLRSHGLTVSPTKCYFAKQHLDYLGYRIQDKTTTPQAKHILAINSAQPPKTKKQLQSFLGLCNWVREYIPRMSRITYPLTHLLTKNTKFYWSNECQDAFDEIKSIVSQPLVLHRPDFSKTFILQTDASTFGLGAVLYQLGEDNESRHIISFSSSSLTNTEKRYHIQELECLAVIWAVKRYRIYLEHSKFILRTDNKALLWLARNADTRSKLTRWALLLQEFSFTMEHCPGKENNLADHLSRNPSEDQSRAQINVERVLPPEHPLTPRYDPVHLVQPVDSIQTQAEQEQDASRPLQRAKARWNQIRQNEPQTRTEERFLNNYTIVNDRLYRVEGTQRTLVIPKGFTKEVIAHFHEPNHPGSKETIRRVSKRFYWKGRSNTVYRYVRHCLTCAQIKIRNLQPAAPMQTIEPTQPFQILSIDTLGPYVLTPRGNKFVLLVEDVFTKWTEARPYKLIQATDLIKFLEEEIIARYGAPQTIVTDNGGIFKSRIFREWCERHHIQSRFSAVCHQRANPTERRVQELKKLLRLYSRDAENKWDVHLQKAMYVLRSRRNAATGYTPAKLVLGHDLPECGEWELPSHIVEREAERSREDLIQDAQANQRRYKAAYTGDNPAVTFVPGQLVLARPTQLRRDVFGLAWLGPYRITKKISDLIYEINKNGILSELHVDDLRPAPEGNDQFVTSDDESDDSYHPRVPDPVEDEPRVRGPISEDTTQQSRSVPFPQTARVPRAQSPSSTTDDINDVPTHERVPTVVQRGEPTPSTSGQSSVPIQTLPTYQRHLSTDRRPSSPRQRPLPPTMVGRRRRAKIVIRDAVRPRTPVREARSVTEQLRTPTSARVPKKPQSAVENATVQHAGRYVRIK